MKSRRSIQVLLPEQGEGGPGCQTLWLQTGVAANFFKSESGKNSRQTLRSHGEGAQEFHRKLWPGIQPPSLLKQLPGLGDSNLQGCMPTSLLFAYIGHMLTLEKRTPEFRRRSYELLKAIIEQLCVFQPQFLFMTADLHGNLHWVETRLSTPFAFQPWTDEFFNKFLQITWMTDLADVAKPWVTSHPSPGQLHLADFLGFSLDNPAWLKKKANAELRWARQVLERCALSVLAQIAQRVDANIEKLTEVVTTGTVPQKSLSKYEKWAYVAQAMELVFKSEDP